MDALVLSLEVVIERNRGLLLSLFGSDDKYGGEFDYSSPYSTCASSHELVDDGANRLEYEKR